MVILFGNNLGERHRDFNAKIAEAVDKKTDFEKVQFQEEKYDIDKLYKIELASRYRIIDYILGILKCGDVFYITRALKCTWLYNNEYSDYINSNYITNNIFPHMSMKMQKKSLTAISMYLKDSDRAIDFYTYCREAELNDYAYKLLVITPDTFKLNVMEDNPEFVAKMSPNFFSKFISSSTKLALAFIRVHGYSRHAMYLIRFFYAVSDEWYLNILEKFELRYSKNAQCLSRLGLRVSKDILKKHISRVIKHPQLYINKLNKNMLIKYLTRKDVESLAFDLLPQSACDFWSTNYYYTYKFILDKIPTNKLFGFIKKIFNSKFCCEEFELAIEFYHLKYYELFSDEEREAWALGYIERDQELYGIENYIWFKFVSFVKAFKGIKHYIFITPDANKRSQIVNILPETARSQEDLTNILEYYYQRHVNEIEEYKESFINKVIELHDLYSFGIECWTQLENLFYSLDVYTSHGREMYKTRALFYYVLHNKILPEPLEEYVNYTKFSNSSLIIDELSAERNYTIAKFLIKYYTEKIKTLIEKPFDVDVIDDNNFTCTAKIEIDSYVSKVWKIIKCFKRKQIECPDIVLQNTKSNTDSNQNQEHFKRKFIPNTEGDFVRWLKQDMQVAMDGISKIRYNTYRWSFRLCRLFRKLKIYFQNDVGEKYLQYFVEYLSDIPKGHREYRNIKMAVVGVFYLADKEFKNNLMDKYVPVSPKVDYKNKNNHLLQVQKAICRLAYHSRPHLPLASVLKYITGDYVHYFLPVYYNYLTNLPYFSKFVEVLLDAPLSIQKHGLYFVVSNYRPEVLKPIITKVWQKTKNVSLRQLLYETLFDRIINESKQGQKELYGVLKQYTTELNQDDHDDVYSLLVSDDLPDEFKGDFIETAWHTVSKLSENTIDMRRKLWMIYHMEEYFHLVQREFPRIHVIDDHVHDVFHMKKVEIGNSVKETIEAKWNLTATYIVSFNNKEEQQRSLQLMGYIIKNVVLHWDYVESNTYVWRKFIRNFVSIIMWKEPKISHKCKFMVPVYNCILKEFTKSLKEEEIYLMTWELRLAVVCRKIIGKGEVGEIKIFRDICSMFGKRVGYMVEKLVEKKEFPHYLYKSIADIIINVGQTICDFVALLGYPYYYIADSLIDIKMVETHVLALMILPSNPSKDWYEEFSSIVKKIKQFDNQEIHNFFHKKYIQSDYCVRRF